MTGIVAESSEILSGLPMVLTAAGILISLLQCFCGYRFIKGWVAFAGFALGFAVGLAAGLMMEHDSLWLPIGIGFLAGVILAFLSYKIYLMGIFLLCGLLAASAVVGIVWPEGKMWQYISFGAALIAFLAAGSLAIRFTRTIVILVTGITGSANAISAATRLFPTLIPDSRTEMFVFLGLAGAGIIIQFLTTKEE